MKHALSLWNGLKPLREASTSTDMFPSDLFFCHSHVILGFIMLVALKILRYYPASSLSMSDFFHRPAVTIGVPMYMSNDLARQHVNCYRTSGSALLSL